MDGADPWQGQQLLEQEQYEMEHQSKPAYAAFVKAQKTFGPAIKGNTNPAFRSKYADLASCIEAVMPALHANELALIQRTSPAEGGVMVHTFIIHASGDEIDCGAFFVPAVKSDPQGYGSAITYARRYSLLAACGIAPEDDDGNAAAAAAVKAAAQAIERAKSVQEITTALNAACGMHPDRREQFREAATKRKNELAAEAA